VGNETGKERINGSHCLRLRALSIDSCRHLDYRLIGQEGERALIAQVESPRVLWRL
jgi:hypothetical protein